MAVQVNTEELLWVGGASGDWSATEVVVGALVIFDVLPQNWGYTGVA